MEKVAAIEQTALGKISGMSLMVGSVLTLLGNVFHPRPDDPASVESFITTVMGTSGRMWQLDHLVLAIGIIFLFVGLVGVYRSIVGSRGEAWAHVGFYLGAVGTAMWLVLLSIDGLALPEIAAQSANAEEPAKSTLFEIAASVHRLDIGLIAMILITYWSAVGCLGIAMVQTSHYPSWLGWLAIAVGGVTVLGIGFPQAIASVRFSIGPLFAAMGFATSVWGLVTGIHMLARTRREAIAA